MWPLGLLELDGDACPSALRPCSEPTLNWVFDRVAELILLTADGPRRFIRGKCLTTSVASVMAKPNKIHQRLHIKRREEKIAN